MASPTDKIETALEKHVEACSRVNMDIVERLARIETRMEQADKRHSWTMGLIAATLAAALGPFMYQLTV